MSLRIPPRCPQRTYHAPKIPVRTFAPHEIVCLPSREKILENFRCHKAASSFMKELFREVASNFANREMTCGMIKVELAYMLVFLNKDQRFQDDQIVADFTQMIHDSIDLELTREAQAFANLSRDYLLGEKC